MEGFISLVLRRTLGSLSKLSPTVLMDQIHIKFHGVFEKVLGLRYVSQLSLLFSLHVKFALFLASSVESSTNVRAYLNIIYVIILHLFITLNSASFSHFSWFSPSLLVENRF